LVGSGHTATVTQAVGKVSEAVRARSSKLSSNVSLKVVRLRQVAQEAKQGEGGQ
jgi:hypothetical protein